ncbi:MAG: MFS transporter [Bdellovibrio sp.]
MNESVWSPLKISVYKSFWICAFLSNLGTWIQDVASSWVMTHLSTSPLVISLLSFSNSLPVLFLSIPSGYVSDLGHRRKILLFSQSLMFLAAGLLAFLVFVGQLSQFSLLGLSLIMGIGFALANPAFQSVLTDLVPHRMHTQAVLVYYMGINITRVLGPTIGGGVLSSFGPSAAFLLNSISYLGLIIFFFVWPVKPAVEVNKTLKVNSADLLPIFSLHNLKLWMEIFVVTFFASSLWALYPTRGRVEMALNSFQYGSLLAFLGLGASVSALLSEKIMLPHRTRKSLAGSYIIYATGILLLGFATTYGTMCLAMFLAGTGWLVLATLMNMSSRQITGKSQLKATMLGVFLAVFYAGMALGAVTWGVVAKYSQSTFALLLSGVGLILVGFVKGLRSALR